MRGHRIRSGPPVFAGLLLLLACAAALLGAANAKAAPLTTRIVSTPGKIVPIPAQVPHEAGDMVDRRIVPDLRWIAQRYPIYVTDGYSGPLPDGRHVGCNRCHVRGSDHYNGLAVDVVPIGGGTVCNAAWAPITRLALWAEPTQNHPILPFRWVGYEGDAGHGCGNHLHLSWNHAAAAEYQLAEWVEVFTVGSSDGEGEASPRKRGRRPAKAKAPAGPPGGYQLDRTGGLSPGGRGD